MKGFFSWSSFMVLQLKAHSSKHLFSQIFAHLVTTFISKTLRLTRTARVQSTSRSLSRSWIDPGCLVWCAHIFYSCLFSKHTNVRWKSLFVEVEAEAEFRDQDGDIWCPYLAKEKQKDTSRFVFLPPQIWLDNVVRDFYLACTQWPRGGIGWHFSSSRLLIHHCNYHCT